MRGVAVGVALLEVSDLSRSFGGLRAVHDVSFSVEAGSVVGLIGPNGAGKSTVFNLVAGALRPDRGRVMFDGRDITGVPTHRIARSGLGRTFQLTRPFATLSVLDNVAIPALGPGRNDLAAARRAAEAVLDLLGLTAWRDQPAEVLSTAGRKRLELARALALRPRLVLLDEVLAGLVPVERQRMVDVLRRLREEGLTLLLVEHVMSAVMACRTALSCCITASCCRTEHHKKSRTTRGSSKPIWATSHCRDAGAQRRGGGLRSDTGAARDLAAGRRR